MEKMISNKRLKNVLKGPLNEMSDELIIWCFEQAKEKKEGTLSKYKIDKLDSIQFPWESFNKYLKE